MKFKRKIPPICCMLFLVLSMSLFSITVNATASNLGDLNGDGIINTTDVVLLRRYIAGGYNVTLTSMNLADVNADSQLNTTDVVIIRRYIAGGYGITLKPALPLECEHTPILDPYVAPSCIASGLSAGSHCGKCSKILSAQTVIPATGHIFTNGFCSACGEPNSTTTECLAFAINSDGKTCTITGIGTCTDTVIEINKTIHGYTVTAIDDMAFANCSNLTEIILPTTLKTIGERAFYGCKGLTEIIIPESVNKIGTQIFFKADNLTTVYYNGSYSPGNQYFNDPENNFLNTISITKIVFGGKKIPNNILFGCSRITEVEILDTVTEIGYAAFYKCSALKSIIIPDSVTSIDYATFGYCTALENVVLPNGIKLIEQTMFENCTSLKSIIIPASVRRIGMGAFYECTSLENIVLPDGIYKIDSLAFSYCSALKSIVIPEDVTSLSDVFTGCSSLASVTIPKYITDLSGTFFSCRQLTEIRYNSTINNWKSITKQYGWDSYTGAYTVYCTDGTIEK